jgi:hypothetical protein
MEAVMRPIVLLLVSGLALVGVSTYAQPIQLGPSGDFRVNDRPGTAPTVGLPGGPSVPPDPTLFRDFAGSKSPDEVLKSLDKDLGRSPVSDAGVPSTGPSPLQLEKDFRPATDQFLK